MKDRTTMSATAVRTSQIRGRLFRGRLSLVVYQNGVIAARRAASNMVLRGGAALIAQLYSGGAGAKPIDTIGVGFGTAPGGADMTALTLPDARAAIPAAALRTAIPGTAFSVVTDQADAVQVKIAALFHPTQDLTGVTEAGLSAGDTLYNQVIFEAVNLRVGQDVTFFWQIDFPFGH